MGKIRTRVIGDETAEKEQKEKQKIRSQEKKLEKKSSAKEPKEEKVIVSEKVEKAKDEKTAEKKESKKAARATARGRAYKSSKKKVDATKAYSLTEAVSLIKEIKYAKFDESVELHFNVDETGLKSEVELPHPTGKTVRIKIVDDALLEQIEKGKLDFDILVTHPSFMPKLSKFAKVLGPKGLMPNPKAGTISPKPEEVAKKFEKGMLRWKTEVKFPLIHQMIGKSSHDTKKLVENAKSMIVSVGKQHIKGVYIKTTMSPSVKIDIEKL